MQSIGTDPLPTPRKPATSMLRSIGPRLFLSVVGGSIMGLIGTSWWSYQELAKRSEAELRSNLQVKAENLEGDFNTFEYSTKLVADAVKTLYTSGERREQPYVDLIQRSLKTSPLGTGLGFGQPPENRLIIPSRRYAYPYAVREQDGDVVAKGGEADPKNFQESYFTLPKAAGKPVWLEPVSYKEDTVNPPRTLVSTSYSLPVYSDRQQLLAILSQDLELGFLSKKLDVQVMREAGNFLLISEKGNLIAYPPDPQKALDLESFSAIGNYANLWQEVQETLNKGEDRGFLRWQNADGKAEYWAYQRFPSNRWVLMAVVPESVVLGPVAQFTGISALFSILGVSLVLGGVVAMFVRQLNRRLQPIMDECNRLAETSEKSEALMSREDELGRLTISFYALLGQVTVNERRLRKEMSKSAQALQALQQAQAQLIQTEKMSSLGQLVAGVAHEINNPINFIYGNLPHARNYAEDLLKLVDLYDRCYPDTDPKIATFKDEIDLEFLTQDLRKMMDSMSMGADRIREIVLSLRNFSRLDEAEMKRVNIHDGIDSTLLILQNRLKGSPNSSGVEIVKRYGELPLVECYPGQLNQVFMNILSNAIDALEAYNQTRSPEDVAADPPTITIQTEVVRSNTKTTTNATSDDVSLESLVPQTLPTAVIVRIRDNGVGISAQHQSKLFDPFFTTKPIGKGTGLGLSISYQIITEKHRGTLKCISEPGNGAEFWIEIPIRQQENRKPVVTIAEADISQSSALSDTPTP